MLIILKNDLPELQMLFDEVDPLFWAILLAIDMLRSNFLRIKSESKKRGFEYIVVLKQFEIDVHALLDSMFDVLSTS